MSSPVSAQRHVVVAVSAVALLVTAVLAVAADWQPARAESSYDVVVSEDFSSPKAEDRFATSGPGTWRVEHGSYLLDAVAASTRSRQATAPLSVMRRVVRSSTWRLETTVRTRRTAGSEFSVVFWHRDRDNYLYLHLDRDPAASGIYRVRRGHSTLVKRVAATVTPGRAQDVELRRNGRKVRVYLGRTGSAPAYVGGTRVGGASYLRAGFGSWGASVVFRDLTVSAPGTTTPDGPTSDPTGDPTTSLPPTPSPSDSPTATPQPGGRAVAVSTSAQLTAALADAQPGDVITMADGTYTSKGLAAGLVIGGKQYYGTFVLERSGTAAAPIILQGTRAAVIDGKPGAVGTGTQYGLYLANADHVTVSGITVTNVTKGIVLDESSHTRLSGIEVHTTGQEGIHLRTFSSDNVVIGNVVHDTGQKNETYGEGLYVGSANSNWGTYSGGLPDRSDRNQLLGNTIYRTGAESMDIKEGTTSGVIRGNTFDGAGMTGSWADSWIDLKGNSWLVEDNRGTNALEDGFQVHQALAGWGNSNVFRDNVATVNGPGYGFWVQNGITGTKFLCANTVTGAASGFANVACSAS
jgi:Right handed beta helix region